jgi:mono/diheme cytochrome c family protein
MLYVDGFAPKSHRALMPFLMVKQNGPEKFRAWEDDFRHIEAYLESLRPPRYPGRVDEALAGQGEQVFQRTCARCHGTYGDDPRWPGKIVAIDEVGTDPVRLTGLSRGHRRNWGRSWFGFSGERPVIEDPAGYVAPPLDGAWASGPYFHNGSVPTLWHVLHPDERPIVWRRIAGREDEYDHERMGLVVTELQEVPPQVEHPTERRHYFDTRIQGKSADGHDFAEVLDEDERRAVLEYLKTL